MMESVNLPPSTVLSKEQQMFIRACVDRLIDLAKIYGFDDTRYSRKPTYNHWLYCASFVGDPMKFVKYKISSFYSSHKGQPVDLTVCPLLDNPAIILGGRAYSFLNKKMRRTQPLLWESFVLSVLHSKKGFPRPNQKALKRAEMDTFSDLTKELLASASLPLDWSEIPSTKKIAQTLSVEMLCHQIDRTCTEIFEDVTYTTLDRVRPFFPSTSANYFNSRGDLGAVGSLIGDRSLFEGLMVDENERLIRVQPLFTEFHELPTPEVGDSLVVDKDRLERRFTTFYERLCKKATDEQPLAVPLALPEALKVRVITKGPPYLYTALKPLQKKLWGSLQAFKVFRLTGEPVTEIAVQDALGARIRDDMSFLSVDYKNATNNLYSVYSNEAVCSISNLLKLSPYEREMFYSSMTAHVLQNPSKEHGRYLFPDDQRKQTRGQLMGSIVSFPILCIINAAICRWAMELGENRVFKLKDCPLLVNGDDAVLKATENTRKFWSVISSFAGLEPSIGKVYFSRDFLNINSTTYNFSSAGFENIVVKKMFLEPDKLRLVHYRLVRYVNLGLLYGVKRSGVGGELSPSDTVLGIAARVRDLLDSCPPPLKERVYGQFLYLHREALRKYRIPWFLPKSYGGLGFPEYGKYSMTNQYFLRKADIIRSYYKVPSMPVEKLWQTWDLAQALYPFSDKLLKKQRELIPLLGSPKQYLSYKDIVSWACVELLFHIEDVHEFTKQVGKPRDILRVLEKFWSRVMKDKRVGRPVNLFADEPEALGDLKLFPTLASLDATKRDRLYVEEL